MPLFEAGRCLRSNEVRLRKSAEDEIEASLSFDASSYYYASIGFNLGLSGLIHRLGSHNRLSIELKSDRPIAFLGGLFRLNGGIYRFPSDKQQISGKYETFTLLLDKIQDGSEGYCRIDEEAISSLPSIEFEFHSETKGEACLSLKNILVYQEDGEREIKRQDKKQSDASLQLPGEK